RWLTSQFDQRTKFPSLVRREDIIIPAHMGRADENLRHGHASIRARHHLASAFLIAAHVDLPELDALVRQQPLGGVAIGAVAGGVNLDFSHDESRVLRILIWESGSLPH